jgi:plastocyanin
MGERSMAALAMAVLLVGGALAITIDPALGHATNSAHIAATDSITVAAVADYGYQPDRIQQVATNATITVTFTDESNLPHTFTIIGKEGWVIPSTYSSVQIDNLGYGSTPPALFNANVTGSGDQVTGTFQSPGPGWYEFVCTVSGHFQNGMYGFVAFGENLPSNLTAPSRVGVGGISPLDAALIGVLFLAFVLGFVVWRRRRSTPKMPPEAVGHAKTAPTETVEVGVGREKGAG